jgi:hypothetical protein
MKLLHTWILMMVIVLGLTQCNVTSNGGDPAPDPNIPKIQLLAGTSSKAWILTFSKIDGDEVINQEPPCSGMITWCIVRLKPMNGMKEEANVMTKTRKCMTQDLGV